MAENSTFLTLETETPGRLLTFKTHEQLVQFSIDEANLWTWLAAEPLGSSIPNSPANTIMHGWSNFRSQITQYAGQPAGYQQVLNTLFKQFVLDPRIPVSGSGRFAAIQEIKNRDPYRAGLVVAAVMNALPNANSYDYFSAFFEIAAVESGLNLSGANAAQKKINEALSSQSVAFQKIVSEAAEHREVSARTNKRQSKSYLRLAREQNDRLRKHVETAKGEFLSSKASIDATHAAYKEHMQLKAPVEYWTEKAKVHKKKADIYRNILGVFALVGGLTLVIGLYLLGDHAINVADKDKPPAIYVILATIGVVSSTIVFWIARVLTRLFLSEHHLTIDAEERAVMISTYLALNADGKISESERVLALTSAFRPSSDGIVKDDGAPEFSPASLLAKLMSGKT